MGFLGCVLLEKRAADRYRRLVAGRRFDAVLPGEAVGEAPHRRRGGICCSAAADRSTKQGMSSDSGAFHEPADDALGDITHGVDCADHLLLADYDIVEQAFKLCRHARINQCRISLFENAEQRQAGLGWYDILSLGNQKTLLL